MFCLVPQGPSVKLLTGKSLSELFGRLLFVRHFQFSVDPCGCSLWSRDTLASLTHPEK